MIKKLFFCVIIIFIYIVGCSNFSYGNQAISWSEAITTNNYYAKKEEKNMEKNRIMKFSLKNDNTSEIIDWIKTESRTNIIENIVEVDSLRLRMFNIEKYEIYSDKIMDILFKIYEDPEMFYISSVRYCYYEETGLVSGVVLEYYIESESQIKSELEQINLEKEKFLNSIDSNLSDLEKVLYTHDYICKLVDYNFDEYDKYMEDSTHINYRIHNINGALVDYLPVCDGYAKTMIYLLKQLNIDSSMVTSNNMGHAWNIVCIDGDYYHLDSTWDDKYIKGRVSYDYFLLSDVEVENRKHIDYVADFECINTKYDEKCQVWNNTQSYLNYHDEYWYFLTPYNVSDNINMYTNSVELNKYDINENELISSKTISNSILSNQINFSPILATNGKKLFFNGRNAIYSMDFEGENLKEFYAPDMDNIIYSIDYYNDIYYYEYLESKDENTYSILEKKYKPLQDIQLESNVKIYFENKEYRLTPCVLPTDYEGKLNFQWQVTDKEILTIDEKGVINPLKTGETLVTVSYGECSASCTVVITEKIEDLIENIQLDSYIEIDLDNTEYRLEPKVTPVEYESKVKLDWQVENPEILTITENGLITPLRSGQTKVTVSCGEFSETCTVCILDILNGLILNESDGYYYYYQDNELQADYTGCLLLEDGTTIYVVEGCVTFDYSWVVKIDGKWTMIKDNKVEPEYTGFGTNENGTWYLQNGEITYRYNRLMKINNKWTMVKANKVEPKYTGLGTNENGTWYLENGEITYRYNGIYVDSFGNRYIIRNNKVI